MSNNAPTKTAKVPPLNIFEACTTVPPPLDFVLPAVLAGTVNGIVSSGGVGKSMLANQVGALVSTGTDTLGRAFGNPKTGPVTILSLEDPAEILRHRIRNIYMTAPADFDAREFDIKCRIFPLVGAGLRIDTRSGYDQICDYSAEQRLVIVDTLRRVHTQDENDNGAMAAVLNSFEEIAKKTGATFLLLHHIPKQGGMNHNFVARGASAITDNMRYMAAMRGLKTEEQQRLQVANDQVWRHVIYEPIKNNYAPPMPATWFVKGPGGVLEYAGNLDAAMEAAAIPAGNQNNGSKNGSKYE